ncbi:MAG: hypothetical protein SCARUB_00037 [Candidatus Scalindua rubra]|uniref:Uncharacterized protein n=1 Tax=Candidatus Scalindua rubra TaxID=1872076 RepID=A0A1E3XGL7_9BACT|nr:MAG: hypothetical protein SCARUB_00037 [Candidatus Scalindua rubra]
MIMHECIKDFDKGLKVEAGIFDKIYETEDWRERVSAFWVASSVLGITCFLEFLQLWHPPFLESIRSTFIGSVLIGTTFTWWDFPHYALVAL